MDHLNRYDELLEAQPNNEPGQGVNDTVRLHANRGSREEGNAEADDGQEESDEAA